mmetsp:Transcript_20500/g.34501  ORF Transcript_20500/g.34501 Transcript_20500/m.34501 type:complete len:496 (-) Transcript_20500:1467-2954(-)|eukprot:CAMPEP_0114444674 /NCGR_PEP_ID=MMETSP0103-20121206/18210_1 /TAXON_ID=37642 ORGANISM="Paraphysomonas imperforata, Strain PA2" /NCGR_SAMPLE_ID=MMETSP0103 /ASSEMBLY_ACC=CAM_ASM_000201 /LENGTH=495 /DNA_ID=CAMNT_0001616223 /DNA_START=39 /DNA_END=1526 /DNA_ORIENTATION=-
MSDSEYTDADDLQEAPLLAGQHNNNNDRDDCVMTKKENGDYGASESVWLHGIALALSYSATYFWRFPIFVLPIDTLEQTVFTIGGQDIDLQTSYSLALTIGFGLAKMSAVSIMSSPFFFRHRTLFLACTLWVSFFLMALGTFAFYSEHVLYLQVICLFCSFYFSSWIYGGMLSFIEGRLGTEALLATMNFSYIYAGNASRGTGQLMLDGGVSGRAMPAVVGMIFCPLSTLLLLYASKIPPPSARDIQSRAKRVAMSSDERKSFLRRNAMGLICMLLPYALLSGIRSFRDFFSQQVFSATVGKDEVPSYMFFTVDIPGALIACVIQYAFHKVHKNSVAYVVMLGCMIASIVVMLLCTIIFDATGRNNAMGFTWQVFVGIGIYVAYSLLGTAAYDRLFGLLKQEGTCTFMIFLGDGLGYVGTTSLLLYRTFSSSDSDDDYGDDSADNEEYLNLFISLVYVGSVAIISCLSFAIYYFVNKSNTFDEVKHMLKYFNGKL